MRCSVSSFDSYRCESSLSDNAASSTGIVAKLQREIAVLQQKKEMELALKEKELNVKQKEVEQEILQKRNNLDLRNKLIEV